MDISAFQSKSVCSWVRNQGHAGNVYSLEQIKSLFEEIQKDGNVDDAEFADISELLKDPALPQSARELLESFQANSFIRNITDLENIINKQGPDSANEKTFWKENHLSLIHFLKKDIVIVPSEVMDVYYQSWKLSGFANGASGTFVADNNYSYAQRKLFTESLKNKGYAAASIKTYLNIFNDNLLNRHNKVVLSFNILKQGNSDKFKTVLRHELIHQEIKESPFKKMFFDFANTMLQTPLTRAALLQLAQKEVQRLVPESKSTNLLELINTLPSQELKNKYTHMYSKIMSIPLFTEIENSGAMPKDIMNKLFVIPNPDPTIQPPIYQYRPEITTPDQITGLLPKNTDPQTMQKLKSGLQFTLSEIDASLAMAIKASNEELFTYMGTGILNGQLSNQWEGLPLDTLIISKMPPKLASLYLGMLENVANKVNVFGDDFRARISEINKIFTKELTSPVSVQEQELRKKILGGN